MIALNDASRIGALRFRADSASPFLATSGGGTLRDQASRARKLLREAFEAVSKWRSADKQLRIRAATLDAYASTFEHPLMEEARRVLGK